MPDDNVSWKEYVHTLFKEHEKQEQLYRDAVAEALRESKSNAARRRESSRDLVATGLSILAVIGTIIAIVVAVSK